MHWVCSNFVYRMKCGLSSSLSKLVGLIAYLYFKVFCHYILMQLFSYSFYASLQGPCISIPSQVVVPALNHHREYAGT